MLIQALGEADAERLKRVYQMENIDQNGEDISSTFNDVFHPDFEDKSFIMAASSENHTVGRNKIKIETEFSYEKFFNELAKISQISEKALTKKEIKEIERLSSLYGIDEETAASVVANNYDPNKEKGSRLDFDSINKEFMQEVNYTHILRRNKKRSKVDSDTMLAQKINLFETKTPVEILQLLQGGTKVAPSDLAIIKTLSKDYHLPNGVINVIIDFVLAMNKNVLSRAYAEKIAASFNREGIETVIDAMNYCNELIKKWSSGRKGKKQKKASVEQTESTSSENEESLDEEWDKLFEDEKGEENDGETSSDLPF